MTVSSIYQQTLEPVVASYDTFGNFLGLYGANGQPITVIGQGGATLNGPQILTNTGITPRVVSTASNTATYSINCLVTDIFKITGQSVPITGLTITGTPTEGQFLMVELTATGTLAFAPGASFAAGNSPLPTTTYGTNVLYSGYIYNSAQSLWLCMFGPVAKGTLFLSANSATPSVNTDLYNNVEITGQSAAITSLSSGLSGTPTAGSTLTWNITATTTIAITAGASYNNTTISSPTTTVGTAKIRFGSIWNTVTSKWDVVAVA